VTESQAPAFQIIREQLVQIRARAQRVHESLASGHPAWPVGRDGRLTALAKISNVLTAAEFAVLFIERHLSDATWWTATFTRRPSSSDAAIIVTEFSQFSKGGLLEGAYGAVESSLRVILRALDPVACNGGTAEFKPVYECLLRSKLALPRPDDVELLDFARTLRNTVHNNGVYYHRKGTDVDLKYRGCQYSFRQGRPVEFATWDLVIQLVDDLVGVLERVVSDGAVNTRPSILDPCASEPVLPNPRMQLSGADVPGSAQPRAPLADSGP
jgi:hypothetical protein